MNSVKLCSVTVVVFLLALAGCSSKSAVPENYDATEIGKVSQVVPGVILSERLVQITQKTNPNSNNMMLSGGDGSQNPQTPLDYNGSDHGSEYIIKLNTGSVISIVQATDVKLKVNQHVLVIYGPTTRVVADQANS